MKRIYLTIVVRLNIILMWIFIHNHINYLFQARKVLIVLSVFLIFSSCIRDRVDTRKLSIINKSNTDIYWVRSENGKFQKSPLNDDVDIVYVNSIGLIRNRVPPWDITIENSKDNKLSFFIVIKDSVEKYGWDSVYKKSLFSKKYLIDIKFLKDTKWTIIYQ